MKSEIVNLHKEFRDKLTGVTIDSRTNRMLIATRNYSNKDIDEEDFCSIIQKASYCATIIENAPKQLKEKLLEILIVENYKYLYKSTWNMQFNDEDFEMMLLYKKLADLNMLKAKLKSDPDFYLSVITNVVELYSLTPNEEYYFLQEGIKKTNMEEKFIKFDSTYIFDKTYYTKPISYDLKSLINSYIDEYEEVKSEYATDEDCEEVIVSKIYESLRLLGVYDIELFNQNIYDILMSNYKTKKEEAKINGVESLSKNDLLYLHQIESVSIFKIIDSFEIRKEAFLDIIYDYFSAEKEKTKIKQKNPNQ